LNTPQPPPPPASVSASRIASVSGASAPTAGALLGALVGHVINVKLGIPDPYSGAIVTGLAGLAAAALHWLASRLGLPLG
jgi:hypothetical protein